MDILIIHPRMLMIYKSMLATGPMTIGSYLDSFGYSVRIIDDNSQHKSYSLDNYAALIRRLKPKVVGLSVNALNAFGAYQLLDMIRSRFPDQIVIGGGLHSCTCAQEMVERGFDVVIKGEAERAVLPVMELITESDCPTRSEVFSNQEALDKLETVPGIIFRTKDGLVDAGPGEVLQDLDELPFINHDLINLEDYIKADFDHFGVTNWFNFQRGCPYQCTFCKASFMGGKIRGNSAEYMFRQLKAIREKYGFDSFYIYDANFPLDKERLHRFCRLMIDSGLSREATIWCQTSVTVPISDEEIDLLKQAGMVMMSIGIERLTDQWRTKIRKAGDQKKVFEITRRFKQRGIKTNANIMIGFPDDDPASLFREMEAFDRLLPDIDYYCIHYVMPLPGSAIYDSGQPYHQWYLRPEIYNKSLSYYDRAVDNTSPALEFNLLGHDRKMQTLMRRFKEEYYFRSLKGANPSFPFQAALVLERVLARISYRLYTLSPNLEKIIFRPVIFIRDHAYKLVLRRFILNREDQ